MSPQRVLSWQHFALANNRIISDLRDFDLLRSLAGCCHFLIVGGHPVVFRKAIYPLPLLENLALLGYQDRQKGIFHKYSSFLYEGEVFFIRSISRSSLSCICLARSMRRSISVSVTVKSLSSLTEGSNDANRIS